MPVVIDDKVPVQVKAGKGEMVFASSLDSLWVSLAQKAFAKVCGSYLNASKVQFEEIWRLLTGKSVTKVVLAPDVDDTFNMLQDFK